MKKFLFLLFMVINLFLEQDIFAKTIEKLLTSSRYTIFDINESSYKDHTSEVLDLYAGNDTLKIKYDFRLKNGSIEDNIIYQTLTSLDSVKSKFPNIYKYGIGHAQLSSRWELCLNAVCYEIRKVYNNKLPIKVIINPTVDVSTKQKKLLASGEADPHYKEYNDEVTRLNTTVDNRLKAQYVQQDYYNLIKNDTIPVIYTADFNYSGEENIVKRIYLTYYVPVKIKNLSKTLKEWYTIKKITYTFYVEFPGYPIKPDILDFESWKKIKKDPFYPWRLTCLKMNVEEIALKFH